MEIKRTGGRVSKFGAVVCFIAGIPSCIVGCDVVHNPNVMFGGAIITGIGLLLWVNGMIRHRYHSKP